VAWRELRQAVDDIGFATAMKASIGDFPSDESSEQRAASRFMNRSR